MKQYGLIGKTLKHSFSKTFFTQKFAEEEIKNCTYDNFELASIEDIATLIKQTPDLKGFNITIPYKESVIPFLDYKNEVVAAINACNCVKVQNGKLYGYNTDVIGFQQSLQPHLQPKHTKALVLGTGGAAKAVQYVLEQLHISYLNVSRSKKANTIIYTELTNEIIYTHPLIVNTTPVGMYPNVEDQPDIPYNALTADSLLYDLVYNPAETKFLKEGKARKATIINGYDMLVLQAEESWRIWND